MKKVILIVAMMLISGFQSAMALTPMTDESLGAITARTGIGNILSLNEIPLGNSGLGNVFNFAEGMVETEIKIEDAVIDIDLLEISLLKSKNFSLGNLSMNGIHMEVGSVSISIWKH